MRNRTNLEGTSGSARCKQVAAAGGDANSPSLSPSPTRCGIQGKGSTSGVRVYRLFCDMIMPLAEDAEFNKLPPVTEFVFHEKVRMCMCMHMPS